MKTFSEMIVVAVTPFSGTTTPDKNGLMPVMLQCMAGKMPNRNVLSGTVAERAGFEVGHTYLAQVRETGLDKVFGEAFTFVKVSELKGVDIIDTINKIGKPDILNIEKPLGFEETYQRKGDAVESLVTKRIKEGNFVPSVKRSYAHETAVSIKEGSTVTGADPNQDLDKNDILSNTRKEDKK